MPLKKARLRISDYNENRKRNVLKQERRVQAVSLSLTSMVDMFAILVIFLLANNNTTPDWLKLNSNINLPKAKLSDVPTKAASLEISKESIYGDGKPLMATKDLLKNTKALTSWLSTLSNKEGFINVLADESLPFGTIKKISSICQSAGFSNMNLVVQPAQE